MNYEKIITTIREIYNNKDIEKNGLTLVYELDDKKYKTMTEEFFYKSNPSTATCIYTDEFEIELGSIIVKFIKKQNI